MRPAVIGLTLIAFGLRLHRLPDANIWWDEGFEIALARESFTEIAWLTGADVHPPLHYWLLHVWSRVAGESAFAGRLLSVFWGVLTVPLIFWLGRRLLTAPLALTAAALLTLSRFHVEWSQQIRMYSLASALAVLGIGLAYQWWQAADGDDARWKALARRRRWGIVAATTLGLANLYVSVLIPVVQTAVAALLAVTPLGGRRLPSRQLWNWLITMLAAGLLYLPWFLFFLSRPRFRGTPLVTPDLGTFLWAYLTVLPLGLSAYLDRYLPFVMPAGLLLATGIVAGLVDVKYQRATVLNLALLAAPPLLLYAATFPNPVLYSANLFLRYLVPFLSAYHLLMALALGTLWRWWRPLALTSGVFLLGLHLWALTDYYPTRRLVDDYQTVARFVQSYARPGDAVLLNSDVGWPVFAATFPADLPRYGVSTRAKVTDASVPVLLGPIVERHEGIWLVTSFGAYDVDPEGHVPRWLAAHARLAGELVLPNRHVALYTTRADRDLLGPTALPPEVARHVTFVLPEGSLELLGHDRLLRDVVPGETLPLALNWRAETPLPDRYDLRLRLRARRGDWDEDQQVRRLPIRPGVPLDRLAGIHRADYALVLPIALPAGRHALDLEVVQRGSGQPVPVRGTNQHTLRLAEINVWPGPERPAPALPRFRSGARFDPWFTLVGYDLSPEPTEGPLQLRAGTTLAVQLHWQSERATEHRYTVFLQLVGEQENPATRNRVWAQRDGYPADGARPTDSWVPGEQIGDRRALALPPNTPPGRYRLIAGLYDLPTGQRLTVAWPGTGGDSVELADLIVVAD